MVSQSRAREFARLARQLQAERNAAPAVVRAIRRMVAARMSVSLAPRWITVGIAEGLIDASAETTNDAPAEALAFAGFALAVAERLEAGYPQVIRASILAAAWREVATARRHAGDPNGSLLAVDRAGEVLRPHAVLAHDQAMTDVARATTLHVLNRGGEALGCLEDAASTFETFGDRKRAGQCRWLAQAIRSAASPS